MQQTNILTLLPHAVADELILSLPCVCAFICLSPVLNLTAKSFDLRPWFWHGGWPWLQLGWDWRLKVKVQRQVQNSCRSAYKKRAEVLVTEVIGQGHQHRSRALVNVTWSKYLSEKDVRVTKVKVKDKLWRSSLLGAVSSCYWLTRVGIFILNRTRKQFFTYSALG